MHLNQKELSARQLLVHQKRVMPWRDGNEMEMAGADEKIGKPTDKPNMIMGANVQVCWEKFCPLLGIEQREVPVEGNRFNDEC